MDKTVVVNKRFEDFDVYIGRGSRFGNPFFVGKDGDRDLVIEKYRAWFLEQLVAPSFKEAVLALKGKRLGCYCKPLPCHGDVIVDYLERLPEISEEAKNKIVCIAIDLFDEAVPIDWCPDKYSVSAENLKSLGVLLNRTLKVI